MPNDNEILRKLRQLFDVAGSPLLPSARIGGTTAHQTKFEYEAALLQEYDRPAGELKSAVGRTDNWYEIHPTSPYCRFAKEDPLITAGAFCTLMQIQLTPDLVLYDRIKINAETAGIPLLDARVQELSKPFNFGTIMLEVHNPQGAVRPLPKIHIVDRLLKEIPREWERLEAITPVQLQETVEQIRGRIKGREEREQGR